MPSSQKVVAEGRMMHGCFVYITRPAGTLFREEGLAHWTVSSNAS